MTDSIANHEFPEPQRIMHLMPTQTALDLLRAFITKRIIGQQRLVDRLLDAFRENLDGARFGEPRWAFDEQVAIGQQGNE